MQERAREKIRILNQVRRPENSDQDSDQDSDDQYDNMCSICRNPIQTTRSTMRCRGTLAASAKAAEEGKKSPRLHEFHPACVQSMVLGRERQKSDEKEDSDEDLDIPVETTAEVKRSATTALVKRYKPEKGDDVD